MRAFLATLLLALSAPAQDLSPYGTGCGARGLLLTGFGSPTPGGVVELVLEQGAPGSPHFLALGLAPASSPLPPGPFEPGCTLLVVPALALPVVVNLEGRGSLAFPIDPSLVGAMAWFQGAGLGPSGLWALTRGVAVSIGAGAPAPVAGRVTRRAGGGAVALARITLFTPALSSFLETRSDSSGAWAWPAVPRGSYRLGVAASGLAYVEETVTVGPTGVTRDHALDPESEVGTWRVIGNTGPQFLDATDIGFLLPDGRVFFCHDTQDPILFDPATGTRTFPTGSGSDQGCTNGTLLEDGSVIEIGGQEGSDFRNATRMVKTWSPAAGWARLPDLLHPLGRWYPGLARLSDGTLLVMGGGQRPDASRTNTCELLDQTTRTWRTTGSMGQAVEFPPCALLYDGKVLRTWGSPELYDPATGQWAPTGAFRAPNRGWPGHSDHSLVVLSDGRALAVGVSVGAGAGAAMAEAYDPAGRSWSARSSPALVRMQTELVALPDGKVLVAGGDKQSRASPVADRLGCVKWCDLYDPTADAWRRVADLLEFREYHAVSMLLPDARVITTGGTRIKFQIGPTTSDVEAWSPPYLFRGVRPAIANPSTTTPRRGEVVAFDVAPATRLTGVVLMGTGAHTHWVDAGVPRRLELPVTQAGTRATVTLPSDPNLLPVGHYLLFAMVDDLPSVARIIRVRA